MLVADKKGEWVDVLSSLISHYIQTLSQPVVTSAIRINVLK